MDNEINKQHENLSETGSSNKASLGSDATFNSDKNTPDSSPLFSPGGSTMTRSFSENFDFNPNLRSYADSNSIAIGEVDSDEKDTPKFLSDESSDPKGYDSFDNLSPDRETPENNSEINSDDAASPVTSDLLTHQEIQEVIEEEDEGEEDENIKRIKDWINKIEIDNVDMVSEEIVESSAATSSRPVSSRTGQSKNQSGAGPVDPKTSVSVAMAYNYISAMNPVTASARLSSLGLVAIPILTAFSGLRELSLSNNNILRITAGSLPKGLHALNLSRNHISAIEGLKDLTHLRVLDLSHNRISRIGHGLAACSSIKELYLAANKISEIEGLHRLLKLKILDVRANKLSTAKGLEQLAANYSSLEAISVDGNPAQRNIGDEHLKKHLLTLLPKLIYYNRHSVKSRGTSKDRLISSHKSSSSSSRNNGKGRQAMNASLTRGLRGKNVNLLLAGNGGPRFGENQAGKKVSGGNPIRRVHSEGAFG